MNKLFVITGPSGSGKTTIMKQVMSNEIVTITTRPPRSGEVEGKDYYFVSKEEFESDIQRNQFIEYNKYLGRHYYGITKEKLENKLEKGHCYSIIDFNGMKKYKELYPDAITIFIYTNKVDLEKQLTIRGDDKKDLERRLLEFDNEMSYSKYYDFVIENKHGKFSDTVKKITAIINSESNT